MDVINNNNTNIIINNNNNNINDNNDNNNDKNDKNDKIENNMNNKEINSEKKNKEEDELEETLILLDELHKQKKYQEIFERLVQLLEIPENQSNIDVLWRYARSCFDLAFEFPNNKKEKEKYIVMGRRVAERMIEIDDRHWASHKWFALLASAHGEFLSTRQKIVEAFQVKKHADIAAQLNPADSTIFHLLGRWCFSVSNVSWIERKVAATIISTPPPNASFDDALLYFKKAQEIAPNYIGNALWIGHTYVKLGKINEAKIWYKKASKLKPSCEADVSLIKESKQCLAKL